MQGPNVKKLICHKMALLMVPNGAGCADGLRELAAPGNIGKRAHEATEWVEQAIAVVKTAPDNPYRDADEAIAGEILRQIEEKKRQRRAGVA